MSLILSLLATQWAAVGTGGAVNFDAVTRSRTLRILSDTPVYVAVGPEVTATDEDCYLNEFDPTFLNVPAGHRVSILGTDTGDVWVTEVKVSS